MYVYKLAFIILTIFTGNTGEKKNEKQCFVKGTKNESLQKVATVFILESK